VSRLPVILNPTAGGGRLLRSRQQLEETAAANGAQLDMQFTRSREHTTELAATAAAEGVPLVLAYGGDGTYNAVAVGLLGSATAMGVLPGGTTSVLAYEFGVPRPATRAVESLLNGQDRSMRVGRSDRGDLILLMLSAGPDSHVLERLQPALKRLGGRVGVALQGIIEAVTGHDLPRMRVVSSNGVNEEAGWVIVGNSRCYGGRHAATPGADPFRADLELVAQRGSGRRAAAAFLLGIPSGRHVKRDDVVRGVVHEVRLEPVSEGDPVPYQVDGDVAGVLPVKISVDPQVLMVRLPAGATIKDR
jgi:diacylglycerol kinase family enzyme